MKTLLILRHAKSDRSDAALPDHDRPLAPRGEADAPRMGIALATLGLIPDCIFTSTAVRARDTAQLVASAMAYRGPLLERERVYGASVDALLEELRAGDDGARTVMLVGHNPGLEELVGVLTVGEAAQPGVRLPTAALACLSLDIETWKEIAPVCGLLEWLLTPRIVGPLLQRNDGKSQK